MKEKFEIFKNEKIVVNVRSQKQYDEFMKMCEEQGLQWHTWVLPTENNYYNELKEETCINLNNLKFLYYCDINFYKNEGYKIITYKDFVKGFKSKHFKSLPNNYTGTIEVNNGFIEEKEILDEVEKEYLRGVIKPFRDEVKYIAKYLNGYYGTEYIFIDLEDDTIDFPNFKKDTMYSGMEVNKEYTLKELGL